MLFNIESQRYGLNSRYFATVNYIFYNFNNCGKRQTIDISGFSYIRVSFRGVRNVSCKIGSVTKYGILDIIRQNEAQSN
jgi:hypothetical protein